MRYYLGGKPLTRFEDALVKLMNAAKPIERTEIVPLTECVNRVLAKGVFASFDVPPFNRAAVDGYAVRSEDVSKASPENPVTLRVVGRIFAGEEPTHFEVNPGTCVEVTTGAPIPVNADCVVPFEDTQRSGDLVLVTKALPHNANLDEKGSDIRSGEKVLAENTLLTPAKIGALAALGHDTVTVYARPKVAVLPTGNEIAKPGAKLRLGQVYDINTYTITSLSSQHGCEPLPMDIVPDEEFSLLNALDNALREADMVVFSAGSSVGQRDFLPRLIERRGELLFHGLAIRPGRPTLAAVVDGKLVVNLPGFPTSCLTVALVLLVPVWRKMAHQPQFQHPTVTATLAQDVKSPEGLRQFLTVRLKDGFAEIAYKESSTITSLSHADGFVVIPEEVTSLSKGTQVTVFLF